MRKITLLIVLCLTQAAITLAQKADTIYYDSNDNICKKAQAEMYSVATLDANRKAIGMVRNYYISGEFRWEGKIDYVDSVDRNNNRYGDGTWLSYYKSQTRMSSYTYLNGQKNGPCLGWYENGKLNNEGSYNNSKRTGTWTWYYSNGQLWTQANYKDNKRDGSFVRYYSNGKLLEEANFKNGKRTGVWKIYFENGLFKELLDYDAEQQLEYYKHSDGTEGYFYDSLKIGTWTVKMQCVEDIVITDGPCWGRCDYFKGKKNGFYTKHSNNRLIKLREGWYVNNKMDSIWTQYSNMDGKKISQMTFKEGKQHGEVKWFYSSGFVFSNYNMGKKEGKETEYYKNGNIYSEYNYTNDTVDGTWKTYFENGKISVEGSYIHGKATGTWKDYYETGTLEETNEWVEGNLKGYHAEYHQNGQIFEEGYHIGGTNEDNAIRSGIWKWYYSDGKIEAEEHYNDKGDKIGTWKTYFESGQLKSVEHYDDEGNYRGIWEEYNENGTLKKSYHMGY